MKKHTYFFSLLVGVMLFASCTDKATMVSKPEDTQEAKQKLNSLALDRKCQVTPEMAKDVAKHFIGSMDKDLANATIKEVIPITDENGKVCMYAVNFSPRGNVILTADIRNAPIYSFSTTGYYSPQTDEGTDPFSCMINEAIAVNKLIAQDFSSDQMRLSAGNLSGHSWKEYDPMKWVVLTECEKPEDSYYDPCEGKPAKKRLPDTVLFQVGPLIQTHWEQGKPYNCYTKHPPFKKRFATGCVAVAMAQIMRFHKYPKRYDWDIMPDECDGEYKDMTEVEKAVAGLLADIYFSVKVIFSSNAGTFMFPEEAVHILKFKFGYNKKMKLGVGFDYPSIKNEIVAKRRPVFMCGLPPKGANRGEKQKIFWKGDIKNGHAFVIDGYKRMIAGRRIDCEGKLRQNLPADYLHINFGWGKTADRWVYISRYWENGSYKYKFVIEDKHNYCYTQRYVIDIHP